MPGRVVEPNTVETVANFRRERRSIFTGKHVECTNTVSLHGVALCLDIGVFHEWRAFVQDRSKTFGMTGMRFTSQDVSKSLDAVIDRAIVERRVVGTVVSVMRGGVLQYHRAAGAADREAGRAMDGNAVFRFASLTKPIVTAAAMQLIERGVMALDDVVTTWLPAFRPRLVDGVAPPITVHHLLTHTAGLSYRFLEPADAPYHRVDVSDGLDQPGLGMEENLRRLATAPLTYRPGTAWGYSLATDVLGAAMAAASGLSLPDLIERTIAAPLGMQDTSFTVRDLSRLVTPYVDGIPVPVRMADGMSIPNETSFVRFAPSRALNPRSYPSGGAGMVGTAGDFMRFLEVVRTGGAPVLHRATVDCMTKPYVESNMPGWNFGYGWAVLTDASRADTPQSVGTVQWGGAYGHSWFVDPANELSVVILTNTAFEGMSGRLPMQIRDALYV